MNGPGNENGAALQVKKFNKGTCIGIQFLLMQLLYNNTVHIAFISVSGEPV